MAMCSSGTAFFVDLDQKATVHSRRNTLRWRKRAGKGHVFIFELKKKKNPPEESHNCCLSVRWKLEIPSLNIAYPAV